MNSDSLSIGKVAGASLALLRRKRELCEGDARPQDQRKLRMWWKVLIEAFRDSKTREEEEAVMRLIKEEFCLTNEFDNFDTKDETVEFMEALMVFEDL